MGLARLSSNLHPCQPGQVALLIADQTRQVDAGITYDSQEPQRIGGAHLLDNYAQVGPLSGV